MNNKYHFVLSVVGLYFVSSFCLAQTYCVDPDGAGSGCAGIVKQSIQEINELAVALAPGDTVLFKRGATFRDSLIVNSSGDDPAVGNGRIVFGAYPEGECSLDPDTADPSLRCPIISCARDITDDLWEGIIGNGGFEDDSQGSGASYGSTWVRKYHGWLTNADTDQKPTKFAQIEALNGNNVLRLQNTSMSSNQFNLQDGVKYRVEGLIKRVETDTVFKIKLLGPTHYLNVSGKLLRRMPQAPHFFPQNLQTEQLPDGWEKFTLTFTGVNSGSYVLRLQAGSDTVFIDDLKIVDTAVNYWSVNPHNALNARVIISDGDRLGGGAEWDSSKTWHALGGAHLVYRYIKDPLNPAELIELGDRRVGILAKEKNYIEIRDLIITGCEASLADITTTGAGILLSNGASNNVVDHVRVESSNAGIMLVSDSSSLINSNNVISNAEVYGTMSQGIAIRNYSANNLITASSVDNLGEHLSDYLISKDGSHQDIEGISLGGSSGGLVDNTVEYCQVTNKGLLEKNGSGIIVFNGTGTTFRHNKVLNVGASGIVVGASSSNSRVHNNLIAGVSKSPNSVRGAGITVATSGASQLDNIEIYNNTVLDCANTNTWGALVLVGNSGRPLSLTNISVKNNIIEACDTKLNPVTGKVTGAYIAYYAEYIDRASLSSDNNIIYREPGLSGAFIFFRNDIAPTTEYWDTLAEYQMDNPGIEQNSLPDKPSIIDSGNFSLQTLSPGIDK